MKRPYHPRGKTRVMLEQMAAEPMRAFTSSEVATMLSTERNAVGTMTATAVRNGALHRWSNGARTFFSVTAPGADTVMPEGFDKPEPEVEEEFLAALYSDGDMVLYGITPACDGTILITGEQLRQIRRLLSGVLS